jgi:uncharacterized protein (TIGR03083 family)
MSTVDDRVSLIRTESERLVRYFKSLSPEDLKRQSACQAWQNADVIAHLCQAIDRFTGYIERGVCGDTAPPEGSAPAGEEDLTVRMATNAKLTVTYRESLGDKLVTTFESQCHRFNQLLASFGPQDWEKPCYHPAAMISVARYVDLRLTEMSVHEWDVRSAIEPQAHLPVEVLPANIDLLPGFIVGRFYHPGSSITEPTRFRFALTGTVQGSYDIVVGEGKARMEPSGSAAGSNEADATFECDAEAFVLLVYGRVSLDEALSNGRVSTDGDRDLVANFGT